ncbi:MAG: 2-isopropylmalate synthase, partial [Candidatus Aenigmatarchaeota archaeon]
MKVEIMDTTLRDGEQCLGVSFSGIEKLNVSKLLLKEIGVDRIEVGSARVSKGEFVGLKKVMNWAKSSGFENRVEILGFVDGKKSVDWIWSVGGRVINILAKGSLKHLKVQLKKNPKEHFRDVKEVIEYAHSKEMDVNVYLEDWSNGMKSSREYVFDFIDFLETQDVKRIMLPDTLGILNFYETEE